MQRPEKEKHASGGRRVRVVIACACAALLLGCAAFLYFSHRQGEKPKTLYREMTNGTLVERKEDEVSEITVAVRGKEPWTLERSPDGGFRLKGGGAEVDSALVGMLLNAAANVTYDDVLTDDPKEYQDRLADFGLSDPLVRATYSYTDGKKVSLSIGESPDADDVTFHYMLVDGDRRLFALDKGTVQVLNTEKELLYDVAQPVILRALTDRITVKDGDGRTRAEWALEGDIRAVDADESWVLTLPVRYPADYEKMIALRDGVANLRLGTYVGEATEALKRECGLENPERQLILHMAAGSTGTVGDYGVFDVRDWPEQSVTLYVGGKKNDLVRYVGYEDGIYTVNAFSLAAVTEIDPISTLARYPVIVTAEHLKKLTVEKDGKTDVYELSVRERTDADGRPVMDERGRTVHDPVCLKNGGEIDYEAFKAAYDRLLVVTVSGELPDGWRSDEAPHTRYVFETSGGARHVLELGGFDAMHDAVTLDGTGVFYLIKNALTDLP